MSTSFENNNHVDNQEIILNLYSPHHFKIDHPWILPDELMKYIFSFYKGDPKTTLSILLTSKHWHQVMMESPLLHFVHFFHRLIQLDPIPKNAHTSLNHFIVLKEDAVLKQEIAHYLPCFPSAWKGLHRFLSLKNKSRLSEAKNHLLFRFFIWDNKLLMQAVAKCDGLMFEHFSAAIQLDKEIAFEAVKNNPDALTLVPKDFQREILNQLPPSRQYEEDPFEDFIFE